MIARWTYVISAGLVAGFVYAGAALSNDIPYLRVLGQAGAACLAMSALLGTAGWACDPAPSGADEGGARC